MKKNKKRNIGSWILMILVVLIVWLFWDSFFTDSIWILFIV